MKKLYGVCAIMLCALLCAGCGRYQVHPLRPLCKTTAQCKVKKEHVAVYVSRMSVADVQAYFNGQHFPVKQAVPLLVTIVNDSPYSVYISPRHISVPVLNHVELIRLMERSTGAPLLAGVGTALVTDVATSGCNHTGRAIGALAGGAAVIAGAAGAISASNDNDNFVADVYGKILHEETLWPGESLTKIVVVPREAFRIPFTIRVCLLVTNEKGKVASKRVLPFRIGFFDDLND